jgi:peptide-methionine (S)-S-oxide reductase
MTILENPEGVAVFGGGCFWCTEAVFGELYGVVSVVSGFAGGHADKPTYYEVCSETTGHAEVVRIEFDPALISYLKLLEVFFKVHDPTTLNYQGADIGTRYRSIILYLSHEQRDQSASSIEKLRASGMKIVTEVVPFNGFYEAEEEHKDFYKRNSGSMYCQVVIQPKLGKMREEFPALLVN